jgi:hypothetical protein
MQTAQELTFAHFRLDLVREQLWRRHEEIPLPGQVFALLRYLVEHAGQLVSKAELFTALWPGTAVTDGALTFCIVELCKALGRLCRESEGERLIAILRHHAPTWLVQLPAVLPAAELDVLQRQTQGVTRERMLREMGDAIDTLTAERPLILWLEDLHWSDVSTLELLALLARRREPAPLLPHCSG